MSRVQGDIMKMNHLFTNCFSTKGFKSLPSHKQMKERSKQILTACRAAVELDQSGFVVLMMSIEKSEPVIAIQNSARCARFESYNKVRGRDSDGYYEIHTSKFNDCLVQWLVRGH